MSIKKTLIVDLKRQRQRWVLTLRGTDADVLEELRATIYASTEKRDIAVLNAASPFGEDVPVAKKTRKPRSDKGARRGDTSQQPNLIGSSHSAVKS